MKKILAILLCLCMVLAVVACNRTEDNTTDDTTAAGTTAATTEATSEEETTEGDVETPVEVEYKLGMGIVVGLDSSASATEEKAGTAQIDATVATVVLGKDGKIVACRLDAVQNKITVNADGTLVVPETFQTKMEKGDNYNMATWGAGQDNNGDGIVKEWYEQAKAFEAWVVGKTADEVKNMPTQTLDNDFGTAGYVISADADLLAAGCTIQTGDFVDAVVKACNDEQGMSFKTASAFTLGVAATSANSGSTNATADANGSVQVYSDFAAAVVVDGKIVATLNDAIQPKIAVTVAGAIDAKTFNGTKRELKEGYNMAAFGAPNVEGGTVKEWYIQSAAFSAYVVGRTATEIASMETKVVNNHYISVEEGLLEAGCTMQITGICAVVATAANNAR